MAQYYTAITTDADLQTQYPKRAIPLDMSNCYCGTSYKDFNVFTHVPTYNNQAATSYTRQEQNGTLPGGTVVTYKDLTLKAQQKKSVIANFALVEYYTKSSTAPSAFNFMSKPVDVNESYTNGWENEPYLGLSTVKQSKIITQVDFRNMLFLAVLSIYNVETGETTTCDLKDIATLDKSKWYVTGVKISSAIWDAANARWEYDNGIIPAIFYSNSTMESIVSFNDLFRTNELRFSVNSTGMTFSSDLDKNSYVFRDFLDVLQTGSTTTHKTVKIGGQPRLFETDITITPIFQPYEYYGKVAEYDNGCLYIKKTSSNSTENYIGLAYNLDYVSNAIACLGLYFMSDRSGTISGYTLLYAKSATPDNLLTESRVWLGEIKGSISTGKWLKTTKDKTETDGFNKNGNISDTEYKPNTSPSGVNDDLDDIPLNQFPINTVSGLIDYYAVDYLDLLEIKSALNVESIDGSKFISSLSMLPFNILDYCTATLKKIKVGGDEINHSAHLIDSVNRVINFGSYEIPDNGSYTDYEPYTNLSLYIPYCGTVPIPTNLFTGTILSVKLIFDLFSGAAKGCVFCNNTFYTAINGNISTQVAISLEQAASQKMAVVNAAVGGIATATSFLTGKALAGVVGVGGLMNAATAMNNISPVMVGNNSDAVCNFYMPQQCILYMTRNINCNSAGHAHAVGAATELTTQIKNLSGYVACNNVDVSGIAATAAEKQEIKSILESGFYA